MNTYVHYDNTALNTVYKQQLSHTTENPYIYCVMRKNLEWLDSPQTAT